MAARRPLTLVGGLPAELPVGDHPYGVINPRTARLSRSGTTLRAAGRQVRLVGPNAYWLALNDNVLDNGLPTYPTRATINETLDAAVAMGANSVRVHSVGISLGKPRTIMPTLDVFDPVAFDVADQVIASAKARGLWLSVPLTDRWDYYHGGAQSLVNMVMPAGQRELYRFWSEPTVRAAFDRYVTALLNHVNPYTGMRWGDDPTLAMWEVANEFYDLRNDDTSKARHASTAALIKQLAPNALVVDGTGASGGRTSAAPGLTDANVDIVTSHYYQDHAMDTAWLPGDAAAGVGAGKVFMVGEYDWTDGGNGQADQNVNVTRNRWLTAIETDQNIAGDYWWTLLVPSAGTHNDFYQLYVPTQNAEQANALGALTAHAALMGPPTLLPSVTPSTPVGGLAAFAKRRARTLPAVLDQFGHDTTLQPSLAFNKVAWWMGQFNSTAIASQVLIPSVTSNGGTTTTATTPGTGSPLASSSRNRVATTTTAGSAGSVRGGVLPYFLSSTAGLGGYHLVLRFGFSATMPATGTRLFAGLVAATIVGIASSDPSTLTNLVGIGWDAADAPGLYLMNRGGSTNAGGGTKTALPGAAFSTLQGGEIYEVELYAPPGQSTQVLVSVRAIYQNATFTTTLTTNLPASGVATTPHLDIANGALAAQYSVDLVSMVCETDN